MLKLIHNIFTNKSVQSGGIFAFFSFLNQGLNFFLLIILSHYILPASYGNLNLFYTAVGVVGYVICLCTSGIVSIKYFKVSRDILVKYINVVLSSTLIVSAILSFVILLFPDFVLRVSSIEPILQGACVYLCAAAVVYNLLLDIYRLEEKTLRYGMLTTVSTLINIVLSLLLVIGFKQDWLGRIEANLIASTVFLLWGCFNLFQKGYLNCVMPTKVIYKETLSFGIPLIPHSINGFLRQGMDRYIINAHFATKSVGLFSFAINFAFIIYSLGSAFNKSNSVYIYKCLSQEDTYMRSRLRKQTVLLLTFYAIFTVILYMTCWFLIPILFPNYKDSVIFLLPLCLSTFFQCIYMQFCNFLFYYKKTKNLMFITVGVSVIHLTLSLLLTRYSVLYTAYISMFSSCIEAFAVYLYSRKLYKIF
ncbi:lipopolysaccharide biosynthesis protein [Prevotella pallens]|jgi:polysaccharide biosynthesis protein|uniref:lipopolysaccharide biosynthesis protein n=1 Tax=Prevotella pallens TaxID=60133 RepID=UPI001CAB6D87|nr:oligosaccharide flippase family protein [Prevotella pallens]MBF1473435.1 oligosaccharide flippase family protein [Prevotella pallens]MBF1517574.1 oligosaccharide flippase family protein [Prevotella pallens]MBF1518585.1 oligosaccharide flippase family protein [Prevotella pallens]